jgi:transcriptional regulator with XRE-family HTH domain
MKRFADRLREARVAVGMTQEQLGFALGLTKSIGVGVGNGRETPSFRMLPDLRRHLGRSLDELVCGIAPLESRQQIGEGNLPYATGEASPDGAQREGTHALLLRSRAPAGQAPGSVAGSDQAGRVITRRPSTGQKAPTRKHGKRRSCSGVARGRLSSMGSRQCASRHASNGTTAHLAPRSSILQSDLRPGQGASSGGSVSSPDPWEELADALRDCRSNPVSTLIPPYGVRYDVLRSPEDGNASEFIATVLAR